MGVSQADPSLLSHVLSKQVAKTYSKRKLKNQFMHLLLVLCSLLALIPLVSVFFYILSQGLPALNWEFLTSLPQPVGETGGGIANAILGTLLLIALASALGIPWGIATGLYLAEYGSGKLANAVRFAVDLLSAIPSIIIGLFIYALFVAPMKGFSALSGGVALGIIMIPIVARSTEELLRLVPVHIREAGLALGIPRWKVTLRIVLAGSSRGIVTGVMLAIARVAGETAPLLFTAFGNQFWQQSLTDPIASIPVQVYTYAISPYDEWHQKAWAGALVLVLLVFGMNLLARAWASPRKSFSLFLRSRRQDEPKRL